MQLDFIFSEKKRTEIEHILTNKHPSHNQRLYMFGFLRNVIRMKNDEIIDLIKQNNNWSDFDIDETERQIYGTRPYKSQSSFTYDQNHDECHDTSIFSKLNNSFFHETIKTAWEYEPKKFNIHGKMNWLPTQYPIYRVVDGKSHFLYYIDIDSESSHLEDSWNIAKQIHDIDHWDFFKFSGSQGFHLCQKTTKSRYELAEKTKEIYRTIKTNLVSYTTDTDFKKPINIDPTSLYQNRFIRGYSINLKSKKYSIPVTTDMSFPEIINISSNINNVKSYLQNY